MDGDANKERVIPLDALQVILSRFGITIGESESANNEKSESSSSSKNHFAKLSTSTEDTSSTASGSTQERDEETANKKEEARDDKEPEIREYDDAWTAALFDTFGW